MNRLYYGDNLHVLRDHIASESVDLVYLDHVIDREKALQGFFLTLTPPTRDMETEAVKAGFVETDHGRFRKLQILTIDALLNGARPEMPFVDSSAFKRAKREETKGKQGEMDL